MHGCMGKALGRPRQTTSSLIHCFSPSLRHIWSPGFLAHRRKQRSRELLSSLAGHVFFVLPSPLFTQFTSSLHTHLPFAGDPLLQTPRGASVGNMSKPQSTNGSESEFEFIETPKAPTPSFEKFEECGVRTTSVRLLPSSPSPLPTGVIANPKPTYLYARRVNHV